MTQMLDVEDKIFKASIINIFKGKSVIMNKHKGNFSRENGNNKIELNK